MDRKLASIQKIIKIEPIENADRIELAYVLGWQVVIRKDEFKEGNLCIYMEVDSILPSDNKHFEFMKDRKYRVKTIKLRKTLSQGLLFPLSILKKPDKYKEGDDVTEVLKIKKYEPPEVNISFNKKNKVKTPFILRPFKRCIATVPFLRKHLGKYIGIRKKLTFPSFLRKTDEPRIQSNPGFLDYLTDNRRFVITSKCDGTSATYYYNKGLIGGCSRTVEVLNRKTKTYFGEDVYSQMFEKYNIKDILKDYKKNIAIQGEVVGPKIQANRLGLKEIDFYVFQIYDIDRSIYYDYEDFINFCNDYKLKTVPIINDNYKFKEIPSVDFLLKLADGIYQTNKQPQEGIVIRPRKEEILHKLGRFSFKVVNNKFLLAYNL